MGLLEVTWRKSTALLPLWGTLNAGMRGGHDVAVRSILRNEAQVDGEPHQLGERPDLELPHQIGAMTLD